MEDKNLKLENAVRAILDGVKPAEVSGKYGINEGTLSTLKKGATIALKLKVGNEVLSTDNTGLESFSCDNCEKLESLKEENLKVSGQLETLKSDLAAASEEIKISADCQKCSTKTELATTMLQISDLKTEIEELKASSSPAVDCDNCEKLADADRQRAEMQAEIDRLAGHKENLMEKCDRLAGELETARAEAQKLSQGKEGKEDVERLKSSLDAERSNRERIESALSESRNSLRTETERVERAESERDTAKKELQAEIENAKNASWNRKWNYILYGILCGGGAVSAGMFTVIWIMSK